jgi:hypothetical protein
VVTESEFYQAVKKACDEAGINSRGRCFVEMTCLDNADVPARVWEMALETLKWFIATGDLEAASRNER